MWGGRRLPPRSRAAIRTFVDPQTPTQVAVLGDVADMDAVMGVMQTKEMADAMEYDGVLPETLAILVEALQSESTAHGPFPKLRKRPIRGGQFHRRNADDAAKCGRAKWFR